MNTISKALNNDEAAELIGISPNTLKLWRHLGKGPRFVKLGPAKQAGVCYDLADVLAWKEERKFASTSAYSPAALENAKYSKCRSSEASV